MLVSLDQSFARKNIDYRARAARLANPEFTKRNCPAFSAAAAVPLFRISPAAFYPNYASEMQASAAAWANSPARVLVPSAALLPAATTVSCALVLMLLRVICHSPAERTTQKHRTRDFQSLEEVQGLCWFLECPLWVISGLLRCRSHARFTPKSGHSERPNVMSAKCQKRPFIRSSRRHGKKRRRPMPTYERLGSGDRETGWRFRNRQGLVQTRVYVSVPTAKGSVRMRLPVAAKTALLSAGPIGGTPGSPTPVGFSVEGKMWTSTFGISSMRNTL